MECQLFVTLRKYALRGRNEKLGTRCQMLVLMLMTMMLVPELYKSVPGPAYDNHAPSNMCAGLEARLLATLSVKL